jgi:VIT1/CCC1 family predicted Fe2+/Mn2+ transporter
MNNFIRRHLDPAERMSELLFGLIMTLTFTLGASLVVKEGPDATRELLIGVIGCNLAWGLIDGLLYIFNAMFSRGAVNRAARLFHKEGGAAVHAQLVDNLTETYGQAITVTTREAMSRDILAYLATVQTNRVRMNRDDLLGAIASFLLVAFTALPAVIPFMLIDNRMVALRVSNFLMIALMYVIGYQWASSIDAHRQRVAFSMAMGGLIIVQLTILLGG